MKRAMRLFVILVMVVMVTGCSQKKQLEQDSKTEDIIETSGNSETASISKKEVITLKATKQQTEEEKVLEILLKNRDKETSSISLDNDTVVYPYLRSHVKSQTLTGGDLNKWKLVDGYEIFLSIDRILELRKDGKIYKIQPDNISADYSDFTTFAYINRDATYAYNISEKLIEKWVLEEKVDSYPAINGCKRILQIENDNNGSYNMLFLDEVDDLYLIDEETKEVKKIGEEVVKDEINSFRLSLYYINYYQEVVMVNIKTGEAEVVGQGAYDIEIEASPTYTARGKTYAMPYIDWDEVRQDIDK